MSKDSPNPRQMKMKQPYPLNEEEGRELLQRLNSIEAAGSHTLQCSVDELRTAADEAGLALFDVNLKGIRGRQNLLNALALAADFPPEFGVNWDALADALCDLSWHGKVAGYVLLLRNARDTLGLSNNDREIAQDLFDDTVVYWRQRRKPFWIFFA